jgi:hypothetical protein
VRFRRKPALTARETWILIGIGAATLVVANTLIGADILLSRSLRGGGAFFAAWTGARAILWQDASPYAAPVVSLTQQLTYGRPAAEGENPYILAIPFYLLPFCFPFALTSTASVARGLWICLNQAALVGTAFLSLAVIQWRPPRTFLLFYAVLAVFGLYSVMALLEGVPAIFLGLLYVGVLWAYAGERDELAGALLALCLFDWEVGAPFILLMLLRIFQERRWNVLAGVLMVAIVLGIISFLIFPGWPVPFLAAILAAIRASYGLTTVAGLEGLFPNQGVFTGQILAALVIVLLIYEWATSRDGGFRRFVWTACLALAAAPLLGFRTELSNLVVLLPSAALIGAASMARRRHGGLLAGIFLALAFLVPWYLFGRWSVGGDEAAHGQLLLVYPLLTVVGLYWTRWWFIHPQQTWVDQIRGARTSP